MSEQEKGPGGMSRRDFLKLMGAAGTSVAFAPFVPWGKFMPNPSSSVLARVPVILPDCTQANLHTFPVNHAEVITYPEGADKVLNEEAFRKWQFIRLPEELGGAKNDISAFRAFSMICLHLWCLWKYWPDEGRKRGETSKGNRGERAIGERAERKRGERGKKTSRERCFNQCCIG